MIDYIISAELLESFVSQLAYSSLSSLTGLSRREVKASWRNHICTAYVSKIERGLTQLIYYPPSNVCISSQFKSSQEQQVGTSGLVPRYW